MGRGSEIKQGQGARDQGLVNLTPMRPFRVACLLGSLSLTKNQLVPDPRPVVLYVGTFKIKYPPTRIKIRSGDHAARAGGSRLWLPIASKNLVTTM